MTVLTDDQAQKEIREAIAFYEKRGWNWVSVAGFLSTNHLGVKVVPIVPKNMRPKPSRHDWKDGRKIR